MRSVYLSLGLFLMAHAAQAAILFSDDFNASLAATQTNATIPGWTVVNAGGAVDYIKQGGFGLNCLGSTGGCIDLDGSSSLAATFRPTIGFNLLAGTTYQVSYYISGNQRGGTDSLTVSFGGVSNTHTNIASNAPFTQFFLTVTPLVNLGTNLVFTHSGGDFVGMILDNVVVADAVPEPGSAALLGLGVAALALGRLRRQR